MSTTTDTLNVLAFTEGAIWSGAQNAAKTQVGTIGLNGADPQAMILTDPTDGVTKVWAVDGTDSLCVDPDNDDVSYWGSRVGSHGKGNFPTRCALTTRYRGRAVLARQTNNATIWYMSRVLDPLDWDYGADPANSAAVAGTDPLIGQPADAITALIAWRDDYLIFGCRSSMYWMVGDPGSGGNVQILSTNTGVLGPQSWTFDENGALYFMASGGLYRFQPGGVPQLLSGKRLYYLLDKIDIEANRVTMAYDAFRRWVLICITPLDGSSATHVQYDPAGDAFQVWGFPDSYSPRSVFGAVGLNDDDRRILIGCGDGRIRKFSATALDDDGTAIETFVKFAPVAMQRGQVESTATELQGFVSAGTEALVWQWHVGPSAEQVNAQDDADAVQTGIWDAGFQDPIGLRATGGFHQFRVNQTSKIKSWALEEVHSVMVEAGRRRQ